MKTRKLITAIFTSLLTMALMLGAGNANAQMKHKAHKAMKMKDCCMMKDGKMMVMKDGKTMEMDQTMTMKNGTVCMANGECTMKNGKKMMMKEGECMDMSGKMCTDEMKKMSMHKTSKKGMAAMYACPMHPEVTGSKPGKCPKCHMDMVKQ
ncbi:MAG: DUF6799 domain-containing protein [Chitinophagaceae bacterium]